MLIVCVGLVCRARRASQSAQGREEAEAERERKVRGSLIQGRGETRRERGCESAELALAQGFLKVFSATTLARGHVCGGDGRSAGARVKS